MNLEIACTLMVGLAFTFAECTFNGFGFIPENYNFITNIIFPKTLGILILCYLIAKYIFKIN